MTQQRKSKYDKVTPLKKVLVFVGVFASIFGGMFMAIVAVWNYQNYLHPYIFSFTFGGIGLAIGLFIGRLIKPYVITSKTMLINYYRVTFMFSISFIGGSLLIGEYINSRISSITKCDDFTVVHKEYHKGGYKRPQFNILYIDIDGQVENLLCNPNYWQKISVGQKVNICIYKSPIGFDNLVLADDN